MVKHYNLGFTEVEVYNDYLVNTICNGFVVMPEHAELLLSFVIEHFHSKKFVYISNRVYSYSVDPTVYHEVDKIDNLIGMIIVSKNPRQKKLCELEGTFYKKNLKYFKTIDEALNWKDTLLSRTSKTKKERI